MARSASRRNLAGFCRVTVAPQAFSADRKRNKYEFCKSRTSFYLAAFAEDDAFTYSD